MPGERTPAIPGRAVEFRNGAVPAEIAETALAIAGSPNPKHRKPSRSVADLLRGEATGTKATPARSVNQSATRSMELFT